MKDRENMKRDPIREKIHDLLWQRGLTMREASLAIGRNPSYMHQFLERDMPKVLGRREVENLAALLGCDPGELRHAERPRRRRRFPARKTRETKETGGAAGRSESGESGETEETEETEETGETGKEENRPAGARETVNIPEVMVEASAGPGALTGEHVEVESYWTLPRNMFRRGSRTALESVRIVRVRGESMEPELSGGDRLVVDTADRDPATGVLFVLWDGNGLVVKRIETVSADGGPQTFRLKSANPRYADYDCLAGDVHIAGRVLWSIREE